MRPNPPVVSGISPRNGPPGTKVTVRGEFLGLNAQDLIGIAICGVDCLLSAEWHSPSKIIARSGAGKGRGDVIVTTRSGGRGTSLVQFRAYFENVGLTQESAVWIDESESTTYFWGRKRIMSLSEFQQDNPLGLSDEGNVEKFPEDVLHTLFPEGSGNLTSDKFVPAWFLLENHNGATFDDLKMGLNSLRHKVSTQKEGHLSFLKANVGSVMDQLKALNDISDRMTNDKNLHGSDMVDKMEASIFNCKSEADELFQDVLGRKDRADAKRNALGVLQRFKFLFNLPCTIEKNIQKGDYDLVISDYAKAKSLFTNTEVQIFKKVNQEVEKRITTFREMLAARMKDLPLPLEEQKRIVRYLVNLEAPGDPAWDCICYQHKYLVEALNSSRDYHIAQGDVIAEAISPRFSQTKTWSIGSPARDNFRKENRFANSLTSLDQWTVQPPDKVSFLEDLTEIIRDIFPDLWKLGQAYFKGDLTFKDLSGSGKIPKMNPEYQNMVLGIIHLYSNLFRAAILPHTLKKLNSIERASLGMWPAESRELMGGWLPRCIRYVRSCHSCLINLDMPGDVLNIIQQLTFDLRVHCIDVMFNQSIEDIRNLFIRETWDVEVNDEHGGTTQLPTLYENIVMETLQLVKEAVLQSGLEETELRGNAEVERKMMNQMQKLLQAFAESLDLLVFQESTPIVSSEKLKSPDCPSNLLTKEKKLMIVLSNCNYTVQNVLPRLQKNMKDYGYPYTDSVNMSVISAFRKLHEKVFQKYVELKADPIVGTIEQHMFFGGFDWSECLPPTSVRPYIKEILLAIITVHAEVFAISPVFVNQVIMRITESILEEVARLYSCITKFSRNGILQGTVDMLALQEALKSFRTARSLTSMRETMNYIPSITNPNEKRIIEEILVKFRRHMKLQLICFRVMEPAAKG